MLSKLLAVVVFMLSLSKALAECRLKGVNIAGFDFGCSSDGKCPSSGTTPPLLSPGKWKNPRINKFKYYSDGIGQMEHFTRSHGLNVYRLPVSWQFLVDYKLGGKLGHNAVGLYNELVQGCLDTGSFCIIDIHNYARWSGRHNIIGQGGPSNEQFASVWRQLADKYKNEERVVFGLMNEPHTFDVNLWSETVQHTVDAIRHAGADSQMILLPGTNYTNALYFQEFSAPDLSEVKNPDGSNHNLIYEVHKYFDDGDKRKGPYDGQCRQDHIKDVFEPLAHYLRAHKRMAFIGEAGGGPTSSCENYICNTLRFVNQNSDVYLGFTGWSAGAFFPDGMLTLTPYGSAKKGWTDQPLLAKCFARNFSGDKNPNPPHPIHNGNSHPAHKNNHPTAHKNNHPPAHKNNHPPAHKNNHPQAHKNNHPLAHKNNHPQAHKNNHPQAHKNNHPQAHKNKNPPAQKNKPHAAVVNTIKKWGKKISPKKAFKKLAHKVHPHSTHKNNKGHHGHKNNAHPAHKNNGHPGNNGHPHSNKL